MYKEQEIGLQNLHKLHAYSWDLPGMYCLKFSQPLNGIRYSSVTKADSGVCIVAEILEAIHPVKA